jgi:hypothetical protein
MTNHEFRDQLITSLLKDAQVVQALGIAAKLCDNLDAYLIHRSTYLTYMKVISKLHTLPVIDIDYPAMGYPKDYDPNAEPKMSNDIHLKVSDIALPWEPGLPAGT